MHALRPQHGEAPTARTERGSGKGREGSEEGRKVNRNVNRKVGGELALSLAGVLEGEQGRIEVEPCVAEVSSAICRTAVLT